MVGPPPRRQFTLFPLLPKELRLIIWEMALPPPRIVNVIQRPLRMTIGEWEDKWETEWPPDPRTSPFGDVYEQDGSIESDFDDEHGFLGRAQDGSPHDPEELPDAEFNIANNSFNAHHEVGHDYPNSESASESETSDEDDNLHPTSQAPFQANLMERLVNSSSHDGPAIRAALGRSLNAYQYDTEAYRDAHLLGIHTDSPPPALLLVNIEAHEVASKRYQKVFSTPYSHAATWFDFERDTLYLRYDTFSHYFSGDKYFSLSWGVDDYFGWRKEEVEKVKDLAILFDTEEDEEEEREDVPLWLASIVRLFKGVNSLKMVPHHFENEGDNQADLRFRDLWPIDRFIKTYKEMKLEGAEYALERWMPVPDDKDFEDLRALWNEMLEEIAKRNDKEGFAPTALESIEHLVIYTASIGEQFEPALRYFEELRRKELAAGTGKNVLPVRTAKNPLLNEPDASLDSFDEHQDGPDGDR